MNEFYDWPKWQQYTFLTLSTILVTALYFGWLYYMVMGGSWSFILVFLVVPIIQFLTTPMNRIMGIFKYYSPMLLVYNPNDKQYDLHNGTSFDYLFVMKWRDRGRSAKNQILAYYMEGFLRIVEEIESGKLPESVIITGTSYFFSESTAKRLGFEVKKPSGFHTFNIYMNYLDLLWMYSYSEGKVAFPSVKNIKRVEISGAEFVKNKAYYKKLMNFLRARENMPQLTIANS